MRTYGVRMNIINRNSPSGVRFERLSEVTHLEASNHWLTVSFQDGSQYGYNREAIINYEMFDEDPTDPVD